MSNLEIKIFKCIKEQFPSHVIKQQYYVAYQNNKLLFDFFMPELKLLIEVQGEQHYTFNKFFHDGVDDFKLQKFRDSLKTQWVQENGYKLLTLKYDEVQLISSDDLKSKIVNSI